MPRIVDYVEQHLDHYAAVVLYSPTPAGGALLRALRRIPRPLLTVPDDSSYARIHAYPLRDPDDWARHPAALEHLRRVLERVEERWAAVGLLSVRAREERPPPLPPEQMGRWQFPPTEEATP